MKLGADQVVETEVISTGSLGLDIGLGIGGLPRGRVVEIYGPESSGKTTLALHVVAEAQKIGGTCAFIDAEHALDPVYAGKLGCNVEELLISQPDAGEQALEIADTRSEEHTSELQSLMRISYDVICLKKQNHKHETNILQQDTIKVQH